MVSQATPAHTHFHAAAADSSSSAGSYLDADFDEAAAAEASNSVQGVQCSTETIEAALTKAFHITGALVLASRAWRISLQAAAHLATWLRRMQLWCLMRLPATLVLYSPSPPLACLFCCR